MKPVLYSLNDSINEFFASFSTVTREECDSLAVSLVGETFGPVPIQGSFSYTVATDSQIVQFRDPTSDLSTTILDLARDIHGSIVPSYAFHGKVGNVLSIYVMEKMPGVPYVSVQTRYDSGEDAPQRSTTVEDYAHFFAASWQAKQTVSAKELLDRLHEYQSRIDLLLTVLPSRFHDNLRRVKEGLPNLFDSDYPQALTHGDLSELNILVDPATGHLTGVIDWAEAAIRPFGMALWGLENVLGRMDGYGWHYHETHDELRSLFWRTLEEDVGGLSADQKARIGCARMAGLFLRYGFDWSDGDGVQPVGKDTTSFAYLDAFCSSGSDSWV